MQSFLTPDTVVRVEPMGPHFTRAEDEHFHDHPWGFTSHVLSGGYVEEVATLLCTGEMKVETVERRAGTSHQVRAKTVHKLIGLIGTDCWTLVEPGQWEQDSGFYREDEMGLWHRYWYEQDWRLLGQKNINFDARH